MSSLASRQPAAHAERRRSSRLLVEIPVSLRTVSGVRECALSNISDQGAMLEIEAPPPIGISGWLLMGDEELYCTVIWSKVRTCGIAFENTLGAERIDRVVGDHARELGPAANRSNIRMGRKRSGLVVGRG
jgi:hypothetical protein